MKIEKQDGRFWGFAYVRPSSEKKVRATLISMGIPEFLPTLPKARMQHSTKIISYIPMIPSYVFLCANSFERTEIKRREERIVALELIRGEYQENAFIRELNLLKKCEEIAMDSPILINPDILIGDEVELTSGPLKGLKTTVISRNDSENAIIVNLSILNKHVEYIVSLEQLKKITS